MRKILSDLEIDLAQYSVGLSFHEVPRYLVLVLVLVSRMTQAASHRDVLKLYCDPPFLPSSPTPMGPRRKCLKVCA